MDEFLLVENWIGYFNKRDQLKLDFRALMRGSYNCLINDTEKVSIRPGYQLFGAEKTVANGIKRPYDWQTSTLVERNMRTYSGLIEVLYDGTWLPIIAGFTKTNFEFTEWWDRTEVIDKLLFVNSDSNIYSWTGGITEIASVTSNTITKKWWLTGTSFSFTAKADAVTNAYISDSSNGFVTAGFAVGDYVVISGSTSNDGTYLVSGVTAGVLTLALTELLTTEASGDTVIVQKENAGTWAEQRFATTGTRKITIGNVEFQYTGGENTGTLTGVTTDPTLTVSPGDIAIQTVVTHSNAPISNTTNDLIGVLDNQVYVGSKRSREVYVSKIADFTDFAFTSPVRVPGEGALLTLDGPLVAFIPQEESMYIFAGKGLSYKTVLELTADGQNETLTVKRLTTGPQQAPQSQGVVGKIKNSVAYITQEPTLDTLGRLESIDTPQSKPLSDPIKNDFEVYDFTDAHVKFWKNCFYIAVPREGLYLIYDFENAYWQPPQRANISCWSIIDGHLYGHSSVGNETYRMFFEVIDGEISYFTNDNGIAIDWSIVHAYRSFGRRDLLYRFDRYYNMFYIRGNTIVNNTFEYDFKGSTQIVERELNGLIEDSEEFNVFSIDEEPGMGLDPMGTEPLSGSVSSADDLFLKRKEFEFTAMDFFDLRVSYSGSGLDNKFELLAHGPNATLSTTSRGYLRD